MQAVRGHCCVGEMRSYHVFATGGSAIEMLPEIGNRCEDRCKVTGYRVCMPGRTRCSGSRSCRIPGGKCCLQNGRRTDGGRWFSLVAQNVPGGFHPAATGTFQPESLICRMAGFVRVFGAAWGTVVPNLVFGTGFGWKFACVLMLLVKNCGIFLSIRLERVEMRGQNPYQVCPG